MLQYKSFAERTPDTQYRNLLARILHAGEEVATQMEDPALMVFGHMMEFDLRNGFPLVTERDLVSTAHPTGRSQFESGIAELCAFLNGARTLEEMKRFGCGWWAPWVTEEKCKKRGLAPGDLGPGSYGPAFRAFPTADPNVIAQILLLSNPAAYPSVGEHFDLGSETERLQRINVLATDFLKPFDQLVHLVEQIRELPHLRTHILTPFIPQYLGRGRAKQQKVVVVPCHGLVHVFVNTKTREMSLYHWQRSADAPVGLVFNLTQYAALLMMLAQVTGYIPKKLVFTVSDAHIYLGEHDQREDVRAMLATEPQRFPTVTIDPDVKSLFDFRPHHFRVADYYPQLGRRRITTPV